MANRRRWMFNPGGATIPCCGEGSPCTEICVHVEASGGADLAGVNVVRGEDLIGVTDSGGDLCYPIEDTSEAPYQIVITKEGYTSQTITVDPGASCGPDGKIVHNATLTPGSDTCRAWYYISGCTCPLPGALVTVTVTFSSGPPETYYGVTGSDGRVRVSLGNACSRGATNYHAVATHPSGLFGAGTFDSAFPPNNPFTPQPIALARPLYLEQYCYYGSPYAMCDSPDKVYITFGPTGFNSSLHGNTYELDLYATSGTVGSAITRAYGDICVPTGSTSVRIGFTAGLAALTCNPIPETTLGMLNFIDFADCHGSTFGFNPLAVDSSYGSFACPINIKFYRSAIGTSSYVIIHE